MSWSLSQSRVAGVPVPTCTISRLVSWHRDLPQATKAQRAQLGDGHRPPRAGLGPMPAPPLGSVWALRVHSFLPSRREAAGQDLPALTPPPPPRPLFSLLSSVSGFSFSSATSAEILGLPHLDLALSAGQGSYVPLPRLNCLGAPRGAQPGWAKPHPCHW